MAQGSNREVVVNANADCGKIMGFHLKLMVGDVGGRVRH